MESIRQIRESNLIELAKYISVKDALILQRISHRLHQLDENACNWGLTLHQERRADRLLEQAYQIAIPYKFTVYHQSDPRGWTLYLVPEDMADPGSHYPEGYAVCPH